MMATSLQRIVYAIFIGLLAMGSTARAQQFFLGADLSYVNEMEDCGVQYYQDAIQKDPYQIFAEQGSNLIRLRLWHTPDWYDGLNAGSRYSDLADVKKAIARAKQHNQNILLDFHLSDNWADPSKQLVPAAWLPVVNNTPVLKDSLYNYIYQTLDQLNQEDLLPEFIQIGNETNKGILLSPEDNAVWTLDWDRNAVLFNAAIDAVHDFESSAEKEVKIILHVAGPSNAEWLIDGFIENGVTNFDVIGLSYYWAWHMPTTIEETGDIIQTLKSLYQDKEVMVLETGYIWTNGFNDNANNIISVVHPDYSPASPINQRDWLIEMTEEVFASGGSGVIYWEPCWQSSPCFTQWGQGSHQEHATFFDFQNNLLIPGGIEWMSHDYGFPNAIVAQPSMDSQIQILSNSFSGDVKIKLHQEAQASRKFNYSVSDTLGNTVMSNSFDTTSTSFTLSNLPFGLYVVSVSEKGSILKSRKIIFGNH